MCSHDDVLEVLGCDDLERLVDPKFLQAHGLVTPGQYGMVCEDVRGQARKLEALGQALLCVPI